MPIFLVIVIVIVNYPTLADRQADTHVYGKLFNCVHNMMNSIHQRLRPPRVTVGEGTHNGTPAVFSTGGFS